MKIDDLSYEGSKRYPDYYIITCQGHIFSNWYLYFFTNMDFSKYKKLIQEKYQAQQFINNHYFYFKDEKEHNRSY